jgi:hypothetical protein
MELKDSGLNNTHEPSVRGGQIEARLRHMALIPRPNLGNVDGCALEINVR